MRYLLTFCFLIALSAQAKNPKDRDHIVLQPDIHCFKIKTLMKELEKFGEEPIFVGKSDMEEDAVTTMYVNQQTGSYTVVEMNSDIGCVLDVGKNVKYRMPKAMQEKLVM